MTEAETFEWLRQRSNRLDEIEAENARLVAENVRLSLENARLTVKPLRDKLIAGENAVTEVMDLRLD